MTLSTKARIALKRAMYTNPNSAKEIADAIDGDSAPIAPGSALTAGTTRTQAGALALTKGVNRVDTSTAPAAGSNLGDGVRLPVIVAGTPCVVINNTANPIQVYGAGTDTINGVATATGIALPPGDVAIFESAAAGAWHFEAGLGSSGALSTELACDAITAAGTTQATATPLLGQLNSVGTVGAGTGVNLPASAPGLVVVVQNLGVNPLLVYPKQGATDTINGVVAANGIALHPGTAATFNCSATGAWTTQPVSPVMEALNLITSADANINITAAQISGGMASVDAQVQAGAALTAGRTWTLPTVAALVLAMHAPVVGSSYRLRITNAQAGAFAGTVTTNTGWTLTGGLAGSLAIPQNTWREFVVTLTSLTTATLKAVANGTWS